jgi:hypothetical protein
MEAFIEKVISGSAAFCFSQINQKRSYLKAKIGKLENFFTAFLTSSYEYRESRIEDFFRIKCAGTSKYERSNLYLACGFTAGFDSNTGYLPSK